MSLLAGQVAMITGAGQGLGRAIALEMASEGCAVALLEQNPETLAQVASEIRGRGADCEEHELDITDHEAYEAVVGRIVETRGKVDDLVVTCAEIKTKLDEIASKSYVLWIFGGTAAVLILSLAGHLLIRTLGSG